MPWAFMMAATTDKQMCIRDRDRSVAAAVAKAVAEAARKTGVARI